MDIRPPAGAAAATAARAYAGLDFDRFPGVAATADIKARSNAVWLAYYLRAPSHHDAGWSGHRAALVAQGWGLAPVYVGQQVIGPGSHDFSAGEGAEDGGDAADRMAAEGFPAGSGVWLDLENGPPYGALEGGYVSSWCPEVTRRGFAAGVYCSHLLADAVAAQNPTARIWVFKVPTIAKTVSRAPFPCPAPATSGFAPAAIWQREQNVQLPRFNLLVDLDVATTPDPSAP